MVRKGFYVVEHVPNATGQGIDGPYPSREAAEAVAQEKRRRALQGHFFTVEEVQRDSPQVEAMRRLENLDLRARAALDEAIAKRAPRHRRLADWAQRIADMVVNARTGNISHEHEIEDAERNLETAIAESQAPRPVGGLRDSAHSGSAEAREAEAR